MQDNLSRRGQGHPQSEGVDLNELLRIVISRWYIIVISIISCLGGAFLYVLKTPQIYKRTASILIKDDGKGKSLVGDLTSTFSDFSLLQGNTNINNELISMKSPTLLKKVVQLLGLRTTYRRPGVFQNQLLYGQDLPVRLFFEDLDENSSMSCRLSLDALKVTLSDFKKDDKPLEGLETINIESDGEVINSPIGRVKVEVNKDADIYLNGEILVEVSSMHGVISQLTERLNISIEDDKSSILRLSLLDESIERGDAIINTLIMSYNENWLVDRNLSAVNVSTFIDSRLGIIEKDLGQVDKNIAAYQTQHLLPNIETASNLFLNEASQVSSQIVELSGRVQVAKDIRNLLKKQDKNRMLPVNSFINNPSLEKQIAEYNEALLKRNNLQASSSERNPMVEELDQSLEELKRVIVISIDNQLHSLETQLANLEKSRIRSTERIAASPKQANFLISEGRQQKIKEALYLFLLQKKEENELSKAFTSNNTRIIAEPHGSPFPDFPNTRNIVLVAFVLGLVIPIALLYAFIMLDNKVRSKADLKSLSLPFLGSIPQLYKELPIIGRFIKKDISNKIVVEGNLKSPINEAFRIARTNLEFIVNQGNKKIIMTTSLVAASGKSFVVINLAKTLALKGKKVLIIDLDIRKASLSKLLVKAERGLTDYLAGMVQDYHTILLSGGIDNSLDFIPAGSIPPNPTELLGSTKLNILVENLRSQYDYIFLDCPPLGIVADVDIIAPAVDITLFVIRAGTIQKRDLIEIEGYYSSKRYPNMIMMLNSVDSSFLSYGYSYGGV